MFFRGRSNGHTDVNLLKTFQIAPSQAKQFVHAKSHSIVKRGWFESLLPEENTEENIEDGVRSVLRTEDIHEEKVAREQRERLDR